MKFISQNITRSLLLFFVGLILATGIFELFLRTIELVPDFRFLPVAQGSFYSPDPVSGYGLRPYAQGFWDTENRAHIEINSLGFRGQEPAEEGVDIVFSGHSLTEAFQVAEDKTFTFLVGKYLGANTANLGISGASPAVVVARLQKYAPILKPKMAVVVVETRFFEWPAVLQDHSYVGYKINPDGTSANLSYGFRQSRGYKIRTSVVGDILYWVLDHFRVVNVLNNTLNRGLFRGLDDLRPQSEVQSKNNVGTLESFFNLWKNGKPEKHSLALDAFLRDISNLQTEHDMNVIIAMTGPWEEAEDATLDDVKKVMDSMSKRYQIDIVNLTPFIQNNYPDNIESVAYRGFRPPWRSGHLNEAGHIIYAKALADIIEKQRP